ncbi:peptidoglycan recognition protein family protein [Streptomyces albidoflavus]|uniref:peptidoglycan recognition protein family protein n=1 Tax=Streptomyces albidoflavus TaxID=1886 RepID=UPI00331DA4AE
MPYLTQLAEVARRTGCPVTEVPGWKSRGHGPQPEVEGIVCHHTAGPTAGGDYPSLAIVRDGRPDLEGPLSHFGLGRSGRIYVIAAGRCWHNAPSTSPYHDNSSSIGIEAENDGRQPWPRPQLDAYQKLVAELCREFGLPASRAKGHKEVNTQKPDPHSIDMAAFRAEVARLIRGGQPPAPAGKAPAFPGRLLCYPPTMTGADVYAWQAQMRDRGWDLIPDGAYGPRSADVCRRFQRDSTEHGWPLEADSVVGPSTWRASFERPTS